MVHSRKPRPVYLTGFMGTGKSTTGAALAAALRVPFVDTDAILSARAGASIPELFRTQGEAAFRAMERQFLEEQLADSTPRVVALGGGSLLDRGLRLRLLQRGILLCLEASPGELLRRLQGAQDRPLLRGADPSLALTPLLVQREEGYAEAHARVSTDGLSTEQIVERLRELAERSDQVVAAGRQSYPVLITQGAPPLPPLLQELAPSSLLLVTDQNVAQHHAASFPGWLDGLPWRLEVLPAGEATKNPSSLLRLWQTLQEAELDRKGLVLGLGGGVVTDLAGLAAGSWLRGIRWVAAPTSLLGMVDAAVGGKTAIDLGDGKNVVGLFHQPAAVHANVELLRTEPQRSFVSGLAEVVKTALLGDAALLGLLESQQDALLRREPALLEQVVRSCVAVKAGVVSRDEREQGERRHLNLGHTLGHAIEAAGRYERRTHGEAVALGTVAALRLGEHRGETEPGLADRIEGLLLGLGLPCKPIREELQQALPLLRHDKKRERDEVHFVLIRRPGEAFTRRIAVRELEAVWSGLA